MRFFVMACIGALLLAGLGGCQKSETVKTSESVSLGEVTSDRADTAVMWVRGMGCPQCSYNVDLQLKKVAGVESVRVDMATGRVFAQLSPSQTPTREQLTEAIKQTGFTLVRLDMPAPRTAASS